MKSFLKSTQCFILLFALFVCLYPTNGVSSEAAVVAYSVADFRAQGDGKSLDTQAIQSAIDAAAEAGGGTVVLPAGTYLSGTLMMKNHIRLHLEPGATLLGSRDGKDYPQTIPHIRSYTDNYVKQSLIFGENLVDVSITGQGTIDGQGDAFKWKEYKDRPYIIRLISCRKVLIEGITLMKSPMWMQHYLDCEDVTVRGIHVFNHVTYNNDGIDIDSCRNVRISDCTFDSDDDALCLKSTTEKPCENITITNCVLSSHCNAFKMGTESNGGFKNIAFSNCVISSPKHSKADYGRQRGISGISLEIVDGGTMDRITISNVSMEGVSVPLFIRLGNRARPYKKDMEKPKVGSLSNVSISNIVATGVSNIGCSITGQPEQYVKNVSLQDIQIEFEGGGTLDDAKKTVEHKPESYPESTMFGVLPAYGFYCRNVDGLTFRNVKVGWDETDCRSAIQCDRVQNLTIDAFEGEGIISGFPMLVLNNVQSAFIHGCRIAVPIDVFMSVGGESRYITLVSNEVSLANKPFVFSDERAKKTFHAEANHCKE